MNNFNLMTHIIIDRDAEVKKWVADYNNSINNTHNTQEQKKECCDKIIEYIKNNKIPADLDATDLVNIINDYEFGKTTIVDDVLKIIPNFSPSQLIDFSIAATNSPYFTDKNVVNMICNHIYKEHSLNLDQLNLDQLVKLIYLAKYITDNNVRNKFFREIAKASAIIQLQNYQQPNIHTTKSLDDLIEYNPQIDRASNRSMSINDTNNLNDKNVKSLTNSNKTENIQLHHIDCKSLTTLARIIPYIDRNERSNFATNIGNDFAMKMKDNADINLDLYQLSSLAIIPTHVDDEHLQNTINNPINDNLQRIKSNQTTIDIIKDKNLLTQLVFNIRYINNEDIQNDFASTIIPIVTNHIDINNCNTTQLINFFFIGTITDQNADFATTIINELSKKDSIELYGLFVWQLKYLLAIITQNQQINHLYDKIDLNAIIDIDMKLFKLHDLCNLMIACNHSSTSNDALQVILTEFLTREVSYEDLKSLNEFQFINLIKFIYDAKGMYNIENDEFIDIINKICEIIINDDLGTKIKDMQLSTLADFVYFIASDGVNNKITDEILARENIDTTHLNFEQLCNLTILVILCNAAQKTDKEAFADKINKKFMNEIDVNNVNIYQLMNISALAYYITDEKDLADFCNKIGDRIIDEINNNLDLNSLKLHQLANIAIIAEHITDQGNKKSITEQIKQAIFKIQEIDMAYLYDEQKDILHKIMPNINCLTTSNDDANLSRSNSLSLPQTHQAQLTRCNSSPNLQLISLGQQ